MTARAIRCARVLTADGWRDHATLQMAADGTIEAISETGSAADEHLSGIVVPGMPNVHSHAFQRQIAGLTARPGPGPDHFWSWREAMYAAAQAITPAQLESLAGGLYAEMLCAGYTSCAEFHYLHHAPGGEPYPDRAEMGGRLLAAADSAGIGLTLLPVLYCRAGLDGAPLAPRQRRFENQPEGFLQLFEASRKHLRDNGLQFLGAAPHSIRAVSGEQLDEVLQGLPANIPLHVHVSEQPAEVRDAIEHLGARPLEWLLDGFPLDAHWCLVHATHADPDELQRAARRGAVAGLCPTTEADLGDGLFEAGHWLECGGAWGVGSDSNLRVAPDEELRLLEFGARLASGRRNVLTRDGQHTGRFLWEQAALGGAQALGQPVGRIEAGRRADLLELDANHPLLAARDPDAQLDTWVFAGTPDMVRSVWVGGHVRVREGRHLQDATLLPPYAAAVRALSTA
ncbi:MAG: formimidoylglutamate deiminase [Xanthomonadales bacterium]|nr:formimidoylglutamate deiminase [Xanthomonadales bacterium]